MILGKDKCWRNGYRAETKFDMQLPTAGCLHAALLCPQMSDYLFELDPRREQG
jgi:hypothetical protein